MSVDKGEELSDWIAGLEVPPSLRATLDWLAAQVDADYEVDVTMQRLGEELGVSPSAAYRRVMELVYRGLACAQAISTARMKRRYLVELRHPETPAELSRRFDEIARKARMEHFAAHVAPTIKREGERRTDLLRRGKVRIEDLWGR